MKSISDLIVIAKWDGKCNTHFYTETALFNKIAIETRSNRTNTRGESLLLKILMRSYGGI